MTRSGLISWFLLALLALGLSACRRQSGADASQPLAQSFQTAEPATKRAIDSVTSHLKQGNYVEAARSLAPVVTQPNLTTAQKQAISLALQQMNQAIEKNPALDTKEMYELRRQMFRAVDGGARF